MFLSFRRLAKVVVQGSVLLSALLLAACGTIDGGIAEPPASENAEPEIVFMTVDATDFRTGKVDFSYTDSDGEIASVKIDWGDGTQEGIDLSATGSSHRYEKPQAYTITLTVTDDKGLSRQRLESLDIVYPPERCVSIEIVDACAQFTNDFNTIKVYGKVLGEQMDFFTLDERKASIRYSLIPTDTLVAKADFNAATVTFDYEACAPFVGCKILATKTISW